MAGVRWTTMWGLVIFLIGIAYGYFAKGRQDKSQLFKTAFLVGIVIALVFALLGYLVDAPALGIGGFIGILIAVAVIALLFIVGVWIGDLIEHRKTKA